MQIATVATLVALLTTTAVTFADKDPPNTLRTPAHTPTPNLLYVMEYDCMFDWEPVKLEEGLTNGVLAWMTQLQDRLTLTSQSRLGDELMVSLVIYNRLILELHLDTVQPSSAQSKGSLYAPTFCNCKATVDLCVGYCSYLLHVHAIEAFYTVAGQLMSTTVFSLMGEQCACPLHLHLVT